jgi:hypothetical protein
VGGFERSADENYLIRSALHRAVSDGDSGKTILKMLIRRLKEVGQERISSGSFAVSPVCAAAHFLVFDKDDVDRQDSKLLRYGTDV